MHSKNLGCALSSMHSLTQEASLKELDNIRQQIHRIKGGEEVSYLHVSPAP